MNEKGDINILAVSTKIWEFRKPSECIHLRHILQSKFYKTDIFI